MKCEMDTATKTTAVQWGETVRMSEKTRTWRREQSNCPDGVVRTRWGMSVLLALILFMLLLSTSAFPVMADSADVAKITDKITDTDTRYTSLQDAFDDAASGQTVRLLDDIDSEAKAGSWPLTVAEGKNFTLDLAGYVIDRGLTEATSDGCVLIVNGSLTLNDSNSARTHTNTELPAGGVITGGKTSGDGGGVYLNGSFTMNGGTIYGNQASEYSSFGGGVYSNGGTMTMTGGAVKGNSASGYGGGIFIDYSGTFTLSGGEISGNTADYGGGGITINSSSSMTMLGGAITGNSASYYYGGGVFCNGNAGSFTISGGTISGNTRYDAANNVYLNGEKKITVGGELNEETSIGITMQTPGVFTNSSNTAYNAAARFTSDNGNYAVGKNAYGQLYLGESRTLTYKANGGTGDDVTEIYVSGSSVTVKDVTDSALSFTRDGYSFIGWNAEADGSGTAYADGASVTLTGNLTLYAQWAVASITTGSGEGTVTTYYESLHEALSAARNGDTIKLLKDISSATEGSNASLIFDFYDASVTLDLNGKTIDLSQINPTGQTGLAFIINNGNLTLKDGSEEQNGQITGGNGVMVIDGTFNMESGTITGCKTGVRIPNLYLSGDYIYEGTGNGTFNLSGGSITGNTEKGVFYETGTFKVSGNPTVTRNGPEEQPANVVLAAVQDPDDENKKYPIRIGIGIGEAGLGDGVEIGVTLEDISEVASKVFTTGLSGKGSASNFSSDNPNYAVGTVQDGIDAGEAFLGYTVTIGTITHGTVTASPTRTPMVFVPGETVTLTLAPDTGYEYKANSLTATYNDGTGDKTATVTQDTTDPLKYTFTMPAGDVTVTASFTEINYMITLSGVERGGIDGSDYSWNETTNTYTRSYTITSGAITLPIPSKTGYTFEGWTGADLTEPTKEVVITTGATGDRLYTATWKTIDYTITYILNGGTNADANPDTYNIESNTITLALPTKASHIFSGWTYDEQTTPVVNVTIAKGSTGDKTFTANWTEITTQNQEVSYSPSPISLQDILRRMFTIPEGTGAVSYGATAVSPAEGTYNSADQTLSVTKSGDFKVEVNTEASDKYASGHAEAQLTVKPLSVTLKANSNESNPYTYNGNPYTVTGFTVWNGENEITGLTFDGVTANRSETNAGEYPVFITGVTAGVTKDSNGNYVVSGTTDGKLVIYPKVTVTKEGNGTVSPESITGPIGTSVTMTLTPSDGYCDQLSYKVNGSETSVQKENNTYRFNLPNANEIEVKAVFNANSYTVKFDGNGATTTQGMVDQTFRYDEEKELSENTYGRNFTVTYNNNGTTTTADAEATFNGWAESKDGTVKYQNKDKVKNLTNIKGGVVTLFAKWINRSVTLPTPTKTGSAFEGWYSDEAFATKVGVGGAPYTPTDNVTLYAKWAENPYTITLVSSTYGSLSTVVNGTSYTESPINVHYGDKFKPEFSMTEGGSAFFYKYRVKTASDAEVQPENGEYTMPAENVTVEAIVIPFTSPKGKTVLIYNAQDQVLLEPGTITSDEFKTFGFEYALGSQTERPSEGWKAANTEITGKNAATYYVWYRINEAVTVYESSEPIVVKIAPKSVTITGLSAQGKDYDGTTTATITGTASIEGNLDGSDLTVKTGTAAFADKNVGDNKTVSFSGFELDGSAKDNYTLSAQPVDVKASIRPKSLSVTAAATNRSYEQGDKKVTVTLSNLTGKISSDDVSLASTSVTGEMTDDAVGNNKPVTYTLPALTGNDAGNYTLTKPDVTVNITPITVTITANGYDDIYDGQPHGGSVTIKDGNNNPYDWNVQYYNGTQLYQGNPTFTDVTEIQIRYVVEVPSGYDIQGAVEGTFTGTFTVKIAVRPVTITAKDQSVTVGGSIKTSTDQITAAGLPDNPKSGLLEGHSISLIGWDSSGTSFYTENGWIKPKDAVVNNEPDGVTKNYKFTYNQGKLIVGLSPISIQAVDAVNSSQLAGVSLKLFNGNVEAAACSTESGNMTCSVSGLQPNVSYTLRVTVVPAGYKIPADTNFSIDVDSTVSPSEIVRDGKVTVSVSKTKVSILRVDSDNNNQPLAGAVLGVFNGETQVGESWTSEITPHEIEGLTAEVTYTIKETNTPENYKKADDSDFTLGTDGSVTGNTDENGVLLVGSGMITYTVKITAGSHMTLDSGSGEQTVKSGTAITNVVYKAADGFYFPEGYAMGPVNGISVTRNNDDDTRITVSGTPTADAEITLADASSKSDNTVASPVITSEPGADATSPSTVSIICDTEGAEIWYTTDGSDPMESTNPNRQRYSDKFTVSGTTTVKAYAKKDGMFPSSVKEKTIIIAEPMTQKVIIHHVKNNGSWGIPADMADDQAELTITIKDGEVVSEGKVTMEISDGKKDSGEIEVTFIPKVENLSDITVKGPAELIGAAPILQKYKLSYKASFKDVINIYVTWDDGKTSTEEKIKVEALPEDEVGAYKILQDGTKMYLLFHTYDICMDWLGSDDLCRGYERCFHKVWPYDINWAK